MSRLSRITQLLFGSSAGTNQIAQFGSLAAGVPAFTTNPATIQSLSNYLTGWFGAVVGGNSAAIEDMNAIHYLYSQQIAYILQLGVPEWDSGTTYYIGSIAQDGNGVPWISLTNSNTGNALAIGTNWKMMCTSGTYNPTYTAIAGSSFAGNNFLWSLNGNIVSVYGTFVGTPANIAGNSQIDVAISLPVAPVANFSSYQQASGTMGVNAATISVTGVNNYIYSYASNKTVIAISTLGGTGAVGSSLSYSATFMYQLQ